ncbi:hypothetical protein IG631_05230 [Alternaria alternata]|nr:hypothetical protein IG631_05230 [Alternaria alternata]
MFGRISKLSNACTLCMPGGFQCRRAYARSKVLTPTPNLVLLAKTRQNNYRYAMYTKIQAVRWGVTKKGFVPSRHAPIRDTVVPVRHFIGSCLSHVARIPHMCD